MGFPLSLTLIFSSLSCPSLRFIVIIVNCNFMQTTIASSRLRLRLVDMLDKAGIEWAVGGVALVIASFVAVVASSIALEAVALVIVLVKRGTQLRSPSLV